MHIAGDDSESELLLLVAEGDEKAFTRAFYHYNRFIYPYVLKKLGSDELAKEIVQEAFLKLWKYREALKETKSPEGYLFRIVANLVQDHFRRKAVEQRMLGRVTERVEWADLNKTDNDIAFQETYRIYEQAIKAMPPQRRFIYDLKQEGFSNQEIADKLGISIFTVKNSLKSAVKNLREYARNMGLRLFLLGWY